MTQLAYRRNEKENQQEKKNTETDRKPTRSARRLTLTLEAVALRAPRSAPLFFVSWVHFGSFPVRLLRATAKTTKRGL